MSDMAPIRRAPDVDRAIAEMEDLFVRSGQAKIKAESMDLRRKRVRATLFCKYKADGTPLAHRSRWQRLTLFTSWPARIGRTLQWKRKPFAPKQRPARCGLRRGGLLTQQPARK